MMTSFYYYDQNPSGVFFLVQIKAFVIQTSLGLPNLSVKGKMKRIVVVVVKWRHRANGLFQSQILTNCCVIGHKPVLLFVNLKN